MTNDLNQDRNKRQSNSDDDLGELFKKMRDQEKGFTPSFPSETALKAREPVAMSVLGPALGSVPHSVQKALSFEYLPQIAASLGVIALLSIFLTNQSEEDPAEIYADIMDNQQTMMTDHLLVVSESLFPAMTEAPSLYDTNTRFETELYAN